MSVQPAPIPFTYNDYRLLPDDGKRRELIEGDFTLSPAPNRSHQRALTLLLGQLLTLLDEAGLGDVYSAPFDVMINDINTVQPDIVVVTAARRMIITHRGVRGVPDLVVEALSNNVEYDTVLKRNLYARHGVREYWLLDPAEKTVEVLSLEAGAYRTAGKYDVTQNLSSPLFPTLKVALAKVFRE